MDYANFIILLARQRSGTNALRSVLGSHPEIFCMPEVFDSFSVRSRVEFIRRVNYFSFLREYARGDIERILPENHQRVFLDFLEYLRCFTDKRYLVVDIKYMSAHHLTKNWRFITEEPFLFSLIKRHKMRVLNITRKNFLRYYLSEKKAQQLQKWHMFDALQIERFERKVTLDIDELLSTLRLCQSENKVIEESFSSYKHYLTLDYEELFSHLNAPLSASALERIARWLEVENDFPKRDSEYKKQSRLPLEEGIENYQAVAQALRGTEFAYCLDDERMYLSQE